MFKRPKIHISEGTKRRTVYMLHTVGSFLLIAWCFLAVTAVDSGSHQPAPAASTEQSAPAPVTVQETKAAKVDTEAVAKPSEPWYSDNSMWDPLESTCRHASLSIL